MRAIIFDIDGTLLQSTAVDEALYRKAVEIELGDVRFRNEWHEYEFVTDSGILAQIVTDNDFDDEQDIEACVKARFIDLLSQHLRTSGSFAEIPGAKQFVNLLKASGKYQLAIATGGWHESAVLKLLSAEFDIGDIPVATANDARDRIGIMKTALKKLDGPFESITYYGDAVWDQRATAALGWNFVAVGDALDGLRSYPASID